MKHAWLKMVADKMLAVGQKKSVPWQKVVWKKCKISCTKAGSHSEFLWKKKYDEKTCLWWQRKCHNSATKLCQNFKSNSSWAKKSWVANARRWKARATELRHQAFKHVNCEQRGIKGPEFALITINNNFNIGCWKVSSLAIKETFQPVFINVFIK